MSSSGKLYTHWPMQKRLQGFEKGHRASRTAATQARRATALAQGTAILVRRPRATTHAARDGIGFVGDYV